MTAAEMAALHARCFTVPRPFTAEEITGFLADPNCFVVGDAAGFAIGQTVLDEAELLTLAVDPDHRRRGIGLRLMRDFAEVARARGADRILLEVAADNAAGLALYHATGFAEIGRRAGYYRAADGQRQDAIVMEKQLLAT